MVREVNVYRGSEITKEHIAKMKDIIMTRFSDSKFVNAFYDNIVDIEDLKKAYGCDAECITIVMGEDWFLGYCVSEEFVNIGDWHSKDDSNVLIRQKEMMDSLKTVLVENADKMFGAVMRHETSYRLFKLAEKKGYVKKYAEEDVLDSLFPIKNEIVKKIILYLMQHMSDEAIAKNYFNQFLSHSVYFEVSKEFILRNVDVLRRKLTPNNVNGIFKP